MSNVTWHKEATDLLDRFPRDVQIKDGRPQRGTGVSGEVVALAAQVNAVLATGQALRELDTTVRLGLQELVAARTARPGSYLVQFAATDGSPAWVRADQVVAVESLADAPNVTVLSLSGNVRVAVAGAVNDVAADIFRAIA